MKHAIAFSMALMASITTLAAPLQWICDWPEAKSQTFSLYQGETATFEPTFRVNGRTVTNATIEAVWYQTNGMGNAWWELSGNTFAPSNDVGAASYRFFVEASIPQSNNPNNSNNQTISYRANGALRMLPSPGFTPNVIEPPVVALDFAAIDYSNAPWPAEIESATNALLSSACSYTDAAISQIVIPEPDFSPSNATLVATIEATSPAPGDYATVSNKAMTALQEHQSLANYATKADATLNQRTELGPWVTDPSEFYDGEYGPYESQTPYWDDDGADGPGWYVFNDGNVELVWLSSNPDETSVIWYASMFDWHEFTATRSPVEVDGYILGTQTNKPLPTLAMVTNNTAAISSLSSRLSLASLSSTNYTDAATNALAQSSAAAFMPASFTETDPTISSWAKAAQKPTYTATEVGAATAEDVYRLIAGTNVVLVVTNYNSATHAPSMKLQHLDPESGQYVTYWDEQRRHGMTLTNAMNYTDAQVETRAPRAWSGTTSGLGAEAPAGVTWISTPETVIAGGFEYEKVVTSAGAVWILTSNGLSTGATTNSFFKVSASDGTELFSIEKTDSYLVGVNATGITKSGNTVTIPVNVVAPSHPYIRATTNLVNAVWTKEDENGFTCPFASASWSGSSGAYVATVTCSQPQAFFYFEFMQQGTAKIKNSAKTEMTGGIIFNGTTYMPTVNGNKLEFVAQ